MEAVAVAEHRGGFLDLPGGERRTDPGRADGGAAAGDRAGPEDLQARRGGRGRDVLRAARVAAHPVVEADQQGRAAVAADHDLAQVLLRREAAERAVEAEHLDPVDAEPEEHLSLLIQRAEQAELPRAVLQDRARVGPEGQHTAEGAALLRGTDQLLYDLTVAQVDAVEKTGGYNHLTIGKSCLCGMSGCFG